MFNLSKNKKIKSISFTLALLLIFSLMPIDNMAVYARGVNLTQIAVSNNYAKYESGAEVSNGLGNVTAYDVYVLEKEGADTSKWERNDTNLKAQTIELIDANMIGAGIKAMVQSYLAAKEYGETTKAAVLLDKIKKQQNTTTGVFGFESITSNMPAYDMLGRTGDLNELKVACKTYVFDEQNVEVATDSAVYGAWGAKQWIKDTDGIWKPIGPWEPGFQSSAQAVRVLDFLYDITNDSEVNNRKNIGLKWLLEQQEENGSFVLGWDDPVTDTAEMIITLDQLGLRNTTEWDKAVSYLNNNALNNNGEFGNYGGIGNNTLIIEAFNIINGQSLSNGTVIDIDIISDDKAIPVGLTKQFGVEAYKFGEGKELLSNSTVNWSTSNSDIVAANEGLLTLYAYEEVKIRAEYNGLEDEKNIDRKANLSVNAVSNNYAEYQNGAEVGNGWGNITSYDVYVLEKEGADTSKWERNNTNLKAETIELIDTLNDEAIRTDSAIKIKATAQAYLAANEYENRTSAAILLSTIKDEQNITTGVFGFEGIYSNMPVYDMLGRVGDLPELNIEACKIYVLEEQNIEVPQDNVFYGAWGAAQYVQDENGDWVPGDWGPDFLSSVQGVRVLDGLYDITSNSEINNRKNIGLAWLLKQQQENGSFVLGGDDPVTDTAEMIITLDQLGQRDTTAWNNAADYLEDYALNNKGEFGSNGGIGNNTLMLEAYNIINEAPLTAGTVIDMVVTPSSIEISVGDQRQNHVEVYRFDSGIDDITGDLVDWSITSNGNVASINSDGEVTAHANGTAVITGEFNNIEKLVDVSVTGGENPGDTENKPRYVKITTYVCGIDDEILYSGVLKLTENEADDITALGALNETGLDYKSRGAYVYEIEGLKEKATASLSGWKYKVNNTIPNVSADNYYLRNKNVVIWFFADGPSDKGPTLNSLIKNANKAQEEEPENNIDVNKAKEDTENMLFYEINKNQKAVLKIGKDDDGKVYLSPKILVQLAEKNMPLLLENGDIKIELKPNALKNDKVNQGMENQKASVEIKADELDKEEKEKLLKKVDSETLIKFTGAGGGIIDVTARLVYSDSKGEVEKADKINQFFEPVKITMNVSEDLSEEELKKLTGVRYETDENGKVVPVKVGGVYDPETKTMTFNVDRFAPYGIAKVDELRKINLQIEQPRTFVNEEEKEMDVAPTIINDRTMVPIRFISETFGAEVEWDEVTKTVKINYEGQVLELVIGQISETMDTPPTIVNDRTLVPLRYISETFDANVLWVPSSRSVEIVK